MSAGAPKKLRQSPSSGTVYRSPRLENESRAGIGKAHRQMYARPAEIKRPLINFASECLSIGEFQKLSFFLETWMNGATNDHRLNARCDLVSQCLRKIHL